MIIHLIELKHGAVCNSAAVCICHSSASNYQKLFKSIGKRDFNSFLELPIAFSYVVVGERVYFLKELPPFKNLLPYILVFQVSNQKEEGYREILGNKICFEDSLQLELEPKLHIIFWAI